MSAVSIDGIDGIVEHTQIGNVTGVDVVHDLVSTRGDHEELVTCGSEYVDWTRIKKALEQVMISIELVLRWYKAVRKHLNDSRKELLLPAATKAVQVVVGVKPSIRGMTYQFSIQHVAAVGFTRNSPATCPPEP